MGVRGTAEQSMAGEDQGALSNRSSAGQAVSCLYQLAALPAGYLNSSVSSKQLLHRMGTRGRAALQDPRRADGGDLLHYHMSLLRVIDLPSTVAHAGA